MIRIIHIITGLDTGGAEMMLLNLLGSMDRREFSPLVVSLTTDGSIGERIRSLGIKVYPLHMRKGFFDFSGLVRLVKLLRVEAPNIIQTWMYHADLMGGLAAKMAGYLGKSQKIPVVWSIHNNSLSAEMIKKQTLWVVRVCAYLSHWLPDKIICCSESAKKAHVAIGYFAEKTVVIPNGFDLQKFYPIPMSRESVLRELGIGEPGDLIGMVARFDPSKDYINFVLAAELFHAKQPQTHFILCGDGVTWENNSLASLISEKELQAVFHLLGRREDIPRLMSALDVFTLSSISESFPNVVGEAMACGVPCVVTDVGDVAFIVGDTGVVVPPRQPEKLAAAWLQVLEKVRREEEKKLLSDSTRRRIEKNFNLSLISKRYEMLYVDILTTGATCAA